jgi:hypothetical protein
MQQQQVNIMDGRPEALYSRPDGKFTIYEEDSTLRVDIAPEFAKMYDNYLVSIQGGIKSVGEGGSSIWVLPKGRATETVLGAATQMNISNRYKKTPPPSVTFTPGVVPQALPGTPPKSEGGVLYSNPYGQLQLPQQGQMGFIPTVEKAVPITIYQDPHTRIQDYSDRCIAVFLSSETYKDKGPYFQSIGGKLTKLYPDGQNKEPRFGYILAKSNNDSMNAITQIIGRDVRQATNFSNAGKSSGKWSGGSDFKQNNTNLTQFMSGGLMLPAPAAVDPNQIPGLTGSMPFVAGASAVEQKVSVDEMISKFMKLDLTEPGRKEDEENIYLWGDKESIVIGDNDLPKIKFDCTMGTKRIVCYGKK